METFTQLMKNGILYIGNRLSSQNYNPTTHHTLTNGLRELGFKIFSASSLHNKYLRLSHMVLSFGRYFNRYNLILIDTYSTQNFWYAVILGRLATVFRKKYVLILHGGSLENRFRESPKTTERLFKNAYRIVSPSLYLKEKAEALGHTSVAYIPNPFFPGDYVFHLRSTVAPKLLWVRAFDEIYNPLLALKTLKVLLQKYPAAELCMIGPKKDNTYRICKNYAIEHNLQVKFKGKLSKDKWKDLSREYHIFLNTTFIDNVPVSVLEAMALGLPVISTKVGGIPYIINDGETGLLVAANDPEEMAAAVAKLLNNNLLAEKISKNALKQVQQLDWVYVKPLWNKLLS